MEPPIAKEIQKLRKSRSSDSEIIEYLLDTERLTKPVTPKSTTRVKRTIRVKLKRQDIIFTATPPPIKQVLQPNNSEINKPQKQLKRLIESEKTNPY